MRSGEEEVESRRMGEEEIGDEDVREEGGARVKWKRAKTAWVWIMRFN